MGKEGRAGRPAWCIIAIMRPSAQLFEQLSETINRLLPRELTDEVRDNVKGGISSVLDQFDLVTREELEVQEAVLRRTREKLESLEAQVAELEQRLPEQTQARVQAGPEERGSRQDPELDPGDPSG